MYISKTTQNVLLKFAKKFTQRKIYEEVASQPYGALFGIQINKVTDSANIEQLGIILRHVLEENQKKGYLNASTVIVLLATNHAIAFYKTAFQYQRLQISDNGPVWKK